MEIYTDGSCLGNPGPGGWAATGPGFKVSGGLSHTTNNIMELTAAIKGLENSGESAVILYTDSCYVKNGITKWITSWKRNGWKTSAGQLVKNQELWMRLDELNGPRVQVSRGLWPRS